MSDVVTGLKSIFANCICGSNDCRNCYEMFGTDQCVSDLCPPGEKRDLIEKILPYLNDEALGLGTLDDINIDELLALFKKV